MGDNSGENVRLGFIVPIMWGKIVDSFYIFLCYWFDESVAGERPITVLLV